MQGAIGANLINRRHLELLGYRLQACQRAPECGGLAGVDENVANVIEASSSWVTAFNQLTKHDKQKPLPSSLICKSK